MARSGDEGEPDAGSGPARERVFQGAAWVLLGVALAARLSNAFLLPPLKDYDAPGHALNAFALYQGQLPDPLAWSGFHPPLYYALGAVAWHLLPEAMPVHVALRLLSLAAGAGAIYLTYRVLATRFSRLDATIVAAVAFCTPVVAIATSMLGNETLCALFVTAALARLCSLPSVDGSLARHAAVTGLLAGLAALSKATGVIAIGAAGLSYGLYARHAPRRALLAMLAAGAGPLLLLTPLYAHLLHETGGSPAAIISGSAASPDARAEMAEQPPGIRHATDYISFPLAALLSPVYSAPELAASVPGLLYATLQADGQGQFLPATQASVFGAGRALALAGLIPTLLVAIGLVHGLRAPHRNAWAGPAALYAALMLAAFLRYVWTFPHFSAVKASYLLGALLPAAIALSLGLDALRAPLRDWVRAALLAVALLDVVLLWQGLWV